MTIIANFQILNQPERKKAFAQLGTQCFALELLPRISRAQSMDILSSQSNLAGYKAVLEAVNLSLKAVPLMMTAAGTVSPAKVLVLGAGVAGLQAIATAKRLGAQVFASDVRPEVNQFFAGGQHLLGNGAHRTGIHRHKQHIAVGDGHIQIGVVHEQDLLVIEPGQGGMLLLDLSAGGIFGQQMGQLGLGMLNHQPQQLTAHIAGSAADRISDHCVSPPCRAPRGRSHTRPLPPPVSPGERAASMTVLSYHRLGKNHIGNSQKVDCIYILFF